LGSRVWGLGSRVWGQGSRVKGLGFGVWGLGSRVWGQGFRVWGHTHTHIHTHTHTHTKGLRGWRHLRRKLEDLEAPRRGQCLLDSRAREGARGRVRLVLDVPVSGFSV